MYLPLAEKMTLKYIQEGKLDAEAGSSFKKNEFILFMLCKNVMAL